MGVVIGACHKLGFALSALSVCIDVTGESGVSVQEADKEIEERVMGDRSMARCSTCERAAPLALAGRNWNCCQWARERMLA